MARKLLALYINGHSKMEHFMCALTPKVPSRCHCKTNSRICLVQTSFPIQIPQPLQQVMIPRTDPILLGQGVLRHHLLPKAGGVPPTS